MIRKIMGLHRDNKRIGNTSKDPHITIKDHHITSKGHHITSKDPHSTSKDPHNTITNIMTLRKLTEVMKKFGRTTETARAPTGSAHPKANPKCIAVRSPFSSLQGSTKDCKF